MSVLNINSSCIKIIKNIGKRSDIDYSFLADKGDILEGKVEQKGKVVITPAYQLENNPIIEFIEKWHLGEDLNLNYYTDK